VGVVEHPAGPHLVKEAGPTGGSKSREESDQGEASAVGRQTPSTLDLDTTGPEDRLTNGLVVAVQRRFDAN
jgi:hypothetical protein